MKLRSYLLNMYCVGHALHVPRHLRPLKFLLELRVPKVGTVDPASPVRLALPIATPTRIRTCMYLASILRGTLAAAPKIPEQSLHAVGCVYCGSDALWQLRFTLEGGGDDEIWCVGCLGEDGTDGIGWDARGNDDSLCPRDRNRWGLGKRKLIV